MTTHYIACDLGAESGRVMLGTLADGKLTLEEIHRFPNIIVQREGSLRWDILRTFKELKQGLANLGRRGVKAESLSVDSWGVDYVWSGPGKPMLAPAHVYRDPRTEPHFERALASPGRTLIFSETGIQFMALNTIYQLMADMAEYPDIVRQSDGFLCIADYLHFLFSGVRTMEESLASTTQLYNPVTRQWSAKLIDALGLPPSIFPGVVPSGTKLGKLAPEVAEETGLADLDVVATCSHDTGAAVAAVPADEGADWAFLSSGTWSLIGVELPSPSSTTLLARRISRTKAATAAQPASSKTSSDSGSFRSHGASGNAKGHRSTMRNSTTSPPRQPLSAR